MHIWSYRLDNKSPLKSFVSFLIAEKSSESKRPFLHLRWQKVSPHHYICNLSVIKLVNKIYETDNVSLQVLYRYCDDIFRPWIM